MIKSLQCMALVTSILSVSLFGGKNIGLTNEIDNLRENIVCVIQNRTEEETAEKTEEKKQITLEYTDGFWIEEDETVYLLASYERQVLEIKKDRIREIPLSMTVLPADIVSYDDHLYVFDDILSELQIYTKQGEMLLQCEIEPEDDYVKQLLVTEEGVAVLTYGNQLIYVNETTGVWMIADAEPVPVGKSAGYDYIEYVATDAKGTVYSVHTKLVKKNSLLSGELTLHAVSAEGEELGCYVLPMEDYAYLPSKYIQVQDNGNIYLLIPTATSVEVRKIALKKEPDSKLQSRLEQAVQLECDYAAESRYRVSVGTASREKVKLTREKVWERAKNMAEYEWTLKKTHTQIAKSEKGVVLPREIFAIMEKNSDKSSWSEAMTGIPYCWGGFHSPYSGFKGKTFQDAINSKYVAGNISANGYYKYMTAGLDCSGFVSAALGLKSKQSTSGILDFGSKVTDIKALEKMDVLVYPGEHVMFFCGWVDETTLLVAESAAREGKVVIHPKSVNELVVNGRYQMRSPW